MQYNTHQYSFYLFCVYLYHNEIMFKIFEVFKNFIDSVCIYILCLPIVLISLHLLFCLYTSFNILIHNCLYVSLLQYLTKQTTALREVNESRLRSYESLEASINDLEKNNIRLQNENATLKKVNKT